MVYDAIILQWIFYYVSQIEDKNQAVISQHLFDTHGLVIYHNYVLFVTIYQSVIRI